MNLEIVKDMTAMARRAADLIVQTIHVNPTLVLGLATGSTQIRLYKELVRRYRQRQVDFAGVRTFNLDEYVGIAADHSHSYRYFMDNHFFRHVNLQKTNIYMVAGTTSNPTRHCEAYEENTGEFFMAYFEGTRADGWVGSASVIQGSHARVALRPGKVFVDGQL